MDPQELLTLMSALDKGTNMFGVLPAHIRARIYAAAAQPSQTSWTDAHGVVIKGVMGTLWQAVLRHTDYTVTSRGSDEPWPAIPTREQILTALYAELA